ncbi:MAG TPA: DUF3043 domain-containing protein [Micromonosporaceae bacterium]
MPLPFRRKSTDLVEDAVTEVTAEEKIAETRSRRRTPSKRELGKATPKRPPANPRIAASTKPLTKQEAREQRRRLRAEAAEEYRREGGPRDRGPERALVRDIVDSRRTIGTWFFAGALIVLIGANPQVMPPIVVLASELAWAALGIGVIIDSVLISRRVKKLVHQRFPKTQERMGSLYLYAIMRAITFRRMRVPTPRVKIGDPV